MILSNITSSANTAAALQSLKVSVLPDPKSSVGYYPTQSRSGTCAAPVPYPPGEPQEVLALPLLVDAFIQGAGVDDENDPDKRPRKANLHFLSSVFANISIVRSVPRIPNASVLHPPVASRKDVLPDGSPDESVETGGRPRVPAREASRVH